MADQDAVTVGLSDSGHSSLQRLKEDGVFGEMIDAYRFAIGLAINRGEIADPGLRTGTIFNVGSLDRDGALRDLIVALYPDSANQPYRLAERLAQAGVEHLISLHDSNQLRFEELLGEQPGLIPADPIEYE